MCGLRCCDTCSWSSSRAAPWPADEAAIPPQSTASPPAAASGAQRGKQSKTSSPRRRNRDKAESSLFHLTKQFRDALTSEPGGEADLNTLANTLGVPKRRIYDVVNVLEGVEMIVPVSRFVFSSIQGDHSSSPKSIRLHGSSAAPDVSLVPTTTTRRCHAMLSSGGRTSQWRSSLKRTANLPLCSKMQLWLPNRRRS